MFGTQRIYLSASQNSPQGNQRTDDVPVVPTKAKLSRGPTADFGMSSMFESSRKRQTIADEDAPPTNSVNDIPTELHFDSPPQFRQSVSCTRRRCVSVDLSFISANRGNLVQQTPCSHTFNTTKQPGVLHHCLRLPTRQIQPDRRIFQISG